MVIKKVDLKKTMMSLQIHLQGIQGLGRMIRFHSSEAMLIGEKGQNTTAPKELKEPVTKEEKRASKETVQGTET